MDSVVGNVLEALFFGNSVVNIANQLTPKIVIEETHTDTSTITKHPVEQGAAVSDHVYEEPSEVVMRLGWGANGLQNLLFGGQTPSEAYQALLNLKATRTPFDLLTLRRAYSNMLIRQIVQTTDAQNPNVLVVGVVFQQVLRVSTVAVQLSEANQSLPEKTAPVQDAGVALPKERSTSVLESLRRVITP